MCWIKGAIVDQETSQRKWRACPATSFSSPTPSRVPVYKRTKQRADPAEHSHRLDVLARAVAGIAEAQREPPACYSASRGSDDRSLGVTAMVNGA
jgi:hypothetical protein